jgi:hypothetical protein
MPFLQHVLLRQAVPVSSFSQLSFHLPGDPPPPPLPPLSVALRATTFLPASLSLLLYSQKLCLLHTITHSLVLLNSNWVIECTPHSLNVMHTVPPILIAPE